MSVFEELVLSKRKLFDYINTFPPLGHPEHHFNKYPNHPWLKSKEEIKSWLFKNFRNTENNQYIYKIFDDLTVGFEENKNVKVHLQSKDICIEYLPIQMRRVQEISLDSCGLKSLIGTPYLVNFMYVNKNNIKDFEGLSNHAKRTYLARNKIKDFKNLPVVSEEAKKLFGIFKRKTFIDVNYNPIESWSGFTNYEEVGIFGYWVDHGLFNNEEKERVRRLILETPKSVERIYAGVSSFKYKGNSCFEGFLGQVDGNFIELSVEKIRLYNKSLLEKRNIEKGLINNVVVTKGKRKL